MLTARPPEGPKTDDAPPRPIAATDLVPRQPTTPLGTLVAGEVSQPPRPVDVVDVREAGHLAVPLSLIHI